MAPEAVYIQGTRVLLMAKRFIHNAGRLRHLVDIQTKVETQDVMGGQIETWSTDHQRKAAIVPISGDEKSESAQVDARRLIKVVMRAQGLTLTEDQRILFGTRILYIKEVRNVEERGRKIIAMCVEDPTNQAS